MSEEKWAEIPGTNGKYLVSDLGRILGQGRHFKKVLKCGNDSKGYSFFRIFMNGGQKNVKVARMVMLAFVGECPEGMQVNHKDGDKQNNRLENLEYVSCGENIRHGWRTGLYKKRQGESHNRSKLSDATVLEIRRRYPNESLVTLARELGVTKQCIWHIVKRKTWTHL